VVTISSTAATVTLFQRAGAQEIENKIPSWKGPKIAYWPLQRFVERVSSVACSPTLDSPSDPTATNIVRFGPNRQIA